MSSVSTAPDSHASASTFDCDYQVEFHAPTNRVAHRPSRVKNKDCGLLIDDREHVLLSFSNRVARGSSKVKKTFALENNIERVFANHAHEGKLTIQLKIPNCSIYIQPSSEQLRVDADAGKVAEPLKHVARVKSLARKLKEIQRKGRHAEILLTLSDEEKSVE